MDVEAIAQLRYWRRADAEVMVDAWRASGLSMAAFAREAGCSEKRLGRWVKSLGTVARAGSTPRSPARDEQAAVPTEGAVCFVEVARPSGVPVLEVAIGGVVVRVPRGFDVATFRQVMAALVEPC